MTPDLPTLQSHARHIRQLIIELLLNAGSGHSAGPLGMTDVFVSLYFAVLKHRPQEPQWSERDIVVLSNGHICPVLYATLSVAGYFPESDLWTFRQLNSKLQGHPNRLDTPGVEVSSGPLGQGLSQAVGWALADRLDQKQRMVYCLCSDGEHDEGQHWEAVMMAAKEKLSHLTVIVDRNNIQIDGFTEDVMPLESLTAKYEAHGWHVQEVDGHNHQAIIDACHAAQSVANRPSVIIAHTIPGKDVDFMQWKPEWHGKPPSLPEAIDALRQLRSLDDRITYE